jgi:hypothetical protein
MIMRSKFLKLSALAFISSVALGMTGNVNASNALKIKDNTGQATIVSLFIQARDAVERENNVIPFNNMMFRGRLHANGELDIPLHTRANEFGGPRASRLAGNRDFNTTLFRVELRFGNFPTNDVLVLGENLTIDQVRALEQRTLTRGASAPSIGNKRARLADQDS